MREILILILLACGCPSLVAVCREQVGVQRKAVFDSIFPLSISGFSVSTAGRMHIFKPVSVQAMWYVRGWAQEDTLLSVSKLKKKSAAF